MTGEVGEAGLVREPSWQRDLDSGDHLGDAPGYFDQAEADRVELGIAPERCPGRQTAQGQQQPIGCGVDQQAELVGGGLGARGAVGGEVQLVRLDQLLGLAARAVTVSYSDFGRPDRWVTMKRLSAPWGPASTRAMTRRSTFQLVAA